MVRFQNSPSSPACWPAKIRLAVTVETPMPSPTNRITFFARFTFGWRDRCSWSISCAAAK